MDAECAGNRRKLIFTKYLHQASYLFNACVVERREDLSLYGDISREPSNRPEDRVAVTWAASALDTENDFSCKYSARQASEQAVLAIQVAPSGKL